MSYFIKSLPFKYFGKDYTKQLYFVDLLTCNQGSRDQLLLAEHCWCEKLDTADSRKRCLKWQI